MTRSLRGGLRAAAVLTLVAAAAVATALPAAASAGGSASPAAAAPAASATSGYAVARPVCAVPADPTRARCLAVRRVPVRKGTRGAVRWSTRAGIAAGPGGGLSPAGLAAAYRYNPDVRRTTQTVAVIDWYDDPSVLADLNHFDRHYGLHTETASSFRKVNQRGRTSPLPARDRGAATEIALDVQAVRAVCHSCRILLVEASEGTPSDLAAAVNTAVRLGATEISNSYGIPEPRRLPASVLQAYNHPGVVITASTGDDGWYGWDYFNDGYAADGAASFPSTASSVVAVGGTTLHTAADGTRTSEYVWNSNGADNTRGHLARTGLGASGGGCSRVVAAPPWQAATAGYAAAGCRGKRLATDIAVDADPMTGLAVYDTYGMGGWGTVGGTSLSAPIVAALYALAGGAGGTSYPASSLYTNRTYRAGALYDVTLGGSGFCAGDETAACQVSAGSQNDPVTATANPNGIGGGTLDCSYPRGGGDGPVPALSPECNAAPGFDGASGVGAPTTVSGLYSTTAALSISHPSTARVRHRYALGLTARQRAAGTRILSVTWYFGDGSSLRGRTFHLHHTWKHAGLKTVSVRVYDSRHQYSTTQVHVRVR